MSNKTFIAIMYAIAALLIVAFLALVFSSCTTAKKATRYMNEHPEVSAKFCAEKYPVKDSAGEVTSDTAKANNVDYSGLIDSLQEDFAIAQSKAAADKFRAEQSHADCLEVVNSQDKEIRKLAATVHALQTAYKPCKPDTIRTTQTIYRTNTAKEKYLEIEAESQKEGRVKAEAEVTRLSGANGKLKLYLWIIGIAVALYVGGRIKRVLP